MESSSIATALITRRCSIQGMMGWWFFDLKHSVWINHLILKNTCLGRSLFFARELALFFVDYISGYDIKLDFVKTIEHHTNWMYGHIHACVTHNLSMYSVTMGKNRNCTCQPWLNPYTRTAKLMSHSPMPPRMVYTVTYYGYIGNIPVTMGI